MLKPYLSSIHNKLATGTIKTALRKQETHYTNNAFRVTLLHNLHCGCSTGSIAPTDWRISQSMVNLSKSFAACETETQSLKDSVSLAADSLWRRIGWCSRKMPDSASDGCQFSCWSQKKKKEVDRKLFSSNSFVTEGRGGGGELTACVSDASSDAEHDFTDRRMYLQRLKLYFGNDFHVGSCSFTILLLHWILNVTCSTFHKARHFNIITFI